MSHDLMTNYDTCLTSSGQPLPHSPIRAPPIHTFLIYYGYIFVFRAALHTVISDFFHLRLGGVISNIATASRCL